MRDWVEGSCVWRLLLVWISPIWTGRKRPEAVSHLFTQQLKNRRFAVLACPPQRLRQPPIALLSDSRHSDFCHSVYDINGFFLPTASDPD